MPKLVGWIGAHLPNLVVSLRRKDSRLLRRFLFLLSALALRYLVTLDATADTASNLVAKSVEVFAVAQQDVNGDGVPDIAVIECNFATGRDRVLVYDQNSDMPAGTEWQTITDFQNDVWVFDASADGTAELIVDFGVEDGRYIALVYDDLDADGQVSYHFEGDQIAIDESKFWHVKASSQQPWAQSSDLANTNVTFQIDGYEGLRYGIGGFGRIGGNGTDGTVDWHIEIDDRDGDGVIDYELARATSPILIQYHRTALHKAAVFAQVTGRQPQPYANTLFWPLLVDKTQAGGRYFDHPPVIAVDWESATIDSLGILGFPIETGYHIFDRLPLDKDTVNTVNWENPMAYYDMAGDRDGWPELQIRFDAKVPYDPYFPYPYAGQVETPNLEVNISWDQDNDDRWDYKMNLGTNYAIEEVVQFPDFAVKSVPYDEIIPWVRQRSWDVAMLVFDGQPTRNSEGMFGRGWLIYRGYDQGGVSSGLDTRYLMGFSDRPPTEYYQDIQEFMRGEYSFHYYTRPKMYLSSLDRQLHLHAAESGVWNLGEGHYLRYANLDGDPYLDQWQEERDGIPVQQLNYAAGVFVYSGESTVQMKQVDIDPALFETQPPGNYDEWQRLDAQLEANRLALPPEDFSGMLAHLEGPETEIREATVRDYRVTESGFRFILELEPDFSVSSDPEGWASALDVPGAYAVSFDGTAWDVRTATPPQPRAGELVVAQPLRALDWTTIEVRLENDGLEDLPDLPVYAVLAGPAGQQILTATLALLPGNGSQQVSWDWTPPAAGTWQARVEIEAGGDLPRQVLLAENLAVEPGSVQGADWFLSLGTRVPPAIVALLAGLALLGGSAGALWAVGLRWGRRL